MRRELLWLCLLGILLVGCAGKPAAAKEGEAKEEPPDTQAAAQERGRPAPTLSVNGRPVAVIWEMNEAVAQLVQLLEKGDITVETKRHGGFEQVGSLPGKLAQADETMTAKPGDIFLYAGDSLTLFYGENTWAYTKLGHMTGLTRDELQELLGGNTATVTLSL